MRRGLLQLLTFFLLIESLLIQNCKKVNSQIKIDQSLGSESSTIKSGLVNGKEVDIIGGGAIRGASLLHSLKDFNILSNSGAYFLNPSQISNIIIRVTGINKSSILGTLGVFGSANLFLLNSNGILFGSQSSLDLKGSFVASTGNGIKFLNGYTFNTTQNDTPPNEPLYTPIKLEVNNNPSNIEVLGTGHNLITSIFGTPMDQGGSQGLKAGVGQTIALVGGKINFDGGIVTSDSGQVQIGGIKSGNVDIDLSKNSLILDFSKVTEFNDISFFNKSLINSSFPIGQDIFGSNIYINSGSLLWNQNANTLLNGGTKITASKSLNVDGYNSVRSGYLGQTIKTNGSNLIVNAGSVYLSNDGTLSTVNFGNFKAGDINIKANSLNINSGGLIFSPTFGIGPGGNINVVAIGNIIVDGFTRDSQQRFTFNNIPDPIGITVTSVGVGNAGDIFVQSSNLDILNGGTVGAIALSKGNGGKTTVNVINTITVSGFNLETLYPSVINSSTFSIGNAGIVDIHAKDIFVSGGGRIDTATHAYGNAGDVLITATDQIKVSGFVKSLLVPSSIDSSTSILNPPLVAIFKLPSTPTGESGSVNIKTPVLSISDNASISVQNQGLGKAGKLDIKTRLLSLDKGGSVVGSTSNGTGGDINIQSDAVLLKNGSFITSSAYGLGGGGNIKVKSDIIAGDTTSGILASAVSSQGGNILLDSSATILPNDFLISTSSQLGPQFNGSTKIEQPRIKLDSSNSVKISFQTSNFIDIVCNGSVANKQAEFVNVKTGSVPPDFISSLNGVSGWYGHQMYLPERNKNKAELDLDDIPEVQQILIGPNGSVSLTSNSIDIEHRHSSITSYCH